MTIRQWILRLPYPLWTISACKPFAPWCFLYDVASWLYPQTFGWTDPELGLWHEPDTWLERMHVRSVERYWRKRSDA